jgi:hypothetical protein
LLIACLALIGPLLIMVEVAGAAVSAVAPVNAALPASAGELVVGQALSAGSGSWSGDGPIAFQYQWQDCDPGGGGCAAIAGATSVTYELTAADVGHTIRMQVLASNVAGEAEVESAASLVVSATWPADAIQLAGGVVSIPVANVSLPDQLTIAQVQMQPTVVTSRRPFLARFLVTDARGYVVRGALVYAVGVPAGLVTASAETTTGTDGWASVTMTPTRRLPLAKGATLAVFVRARKPDEDLLKGVAARRLIGVTLGQPTTAANPYLASAQGVDLSWPNCNRQQPPTAAFAIIGVNDGHPFSTNPCLPRQYGWYLQTHPTGLYLNTGYTPHYQPQVTGSCAQQGTSLGLAKPQAQAYAIGCSETSSSVQRLEQLHLPIPAIFWLDVETDGIWSANQQLNVQALRGMIDELNTLQPQATVGIYSFPPMWRQITGNWPTNLPEWIPRTNGNNPCHTPFSFGPVWIAQGGTHSLDTDQPC